MAGPGAGEARITLEAGSSRFVATTRAGKGPVTAERLIEVLPQLSQQMVAILERTKAREERDR